MAYTPTTWANGDTITAAGLNKMEQGIAAASDSYPGWDAVIKLEYTFYDEDPPTLEYEILKGSFAETVAKRQAGGVLSVLLSAEGYYGGELVAETSTCPAWTVLKGSTVSSPISLSMTTSSVFPGVIWSSEGIEIDPSW